MIKKTDDELHIFAEVRKVTRGYPEGGPFEWLEVNRQIKHIDECIKEVKQQYPYVAKFSNGNEKPLHAVEERGKEYLRTNHDNTTQNNFHNLPVLTKQEIDRVQT